MPKQYYTIRDWSGGSNNRRDPRDLAENEFPMIQNMSIDALGKIKTLGGLFDHVEGSDGTTDLSEFIVNRTCDIEGSGGYGLFYFESDHSRDSDYTITDTKHPGTSDNLTIGTSASGNVGKINFVLVESSTDVPPFDGESSE